MTLGLSRVIETQSATNWSRLIPPAEHIQRHGFVVGGIYVSKATVT